MRQRTLTQQLFLRIVPTILVSVLIIGGVAFYSAYSEISEEYDEQLISHANTLWTLFRDEVQERIETGQTTDDWSVKYAGPDLPEDEGGDYSNARMFRVWRNGRILFYSDTALPKEIPEQKTGFSNILFKGERWRIYHLDIPDIKASAEVGEKVALRTAVSTDIMFDLAIPLLILVPVVGFLIWYGISNGLRPVRMLVQQIGTRSADDLAPVVVDNMPRDILPLLGSLNQLLMRLEKSFAAEKCFTDNAAHQLRTPLAALNLNLQMLAESEDATERQALTRALMASNERASLLVRNLLTMARLPHQAMALRPIEMHQVIASVMADIGALAMRKGIEMSLKAQGEAFVMADETLLRLVLSNLVDNAVKYTPAGGSIEVELDDSASDSCRLTIIDSGPGIPEGERAQVFDRFYRIATPGVEGSGMGLSIVAEALTRLGGEIAFHAAPETSGLYVELRLPRATGGA